MNRRFKRTIERGPGNESLTENWNKYRAVFESLDNPVIQLDRDNRINHLNYAADEMFGGLSIPGASNSGQASADQKLAYQIKNLTAMTISSTPEIALEKQLETGSGRRNFQMKLKRIVDARGTFRGTVIVLTDITEHRQVEEKNRRQAFELGERVKVLDCLYSITKLLQKASISTAELLQESVDLIPPGWQYPEETCARINFDGKEIRSGNFKDTVWKQASDIVVFGENRGSLEVFYLEGKPELDEGPFLKEERKLISAITKSLGQIIERKQMEEEVRQQKNFLSNAIESLSHPFYVIDASDYQLVLTNSAARNEGSVEKKTCFNLTHRSSKPCRKIDHPCPLREVKKTGKPMIMEHVHYDKNGILRNVEVHGFPMFDSKGKVVQMMEYSLDITKRRQAEEKIRRLNEELEERILERTAALQASNKELEAFAYSVSHDLRAPLRHIEGFADMLSKQIASILDEKSRHQLDNIATAAQQMDSLIDHLLAFSRMDRADIQRTQIALKALVKEVLHQLELQTAGRTIHWKFGQLPVVYADPAMLRQVLFNLISNAVKFTFNRKEACIEIGGQITESETVVFVRDNGVGFNMKYVGKLFGVFQRLHSKEEFEGTGIGLAIVRRLVQRHGGRTWADGALNSGASFYFTLPNYREE